MGTASSKTLRRQACSTAHGDAVQLSSSDIDDEALGELVIRHADIRHRDTGIWSAVTAPKIIDRTLAVLRALHQDNLAAMQSRKAENKRAQAACSAAGASGRSTWLRTNADYEQWRAEAAQLDGAVTRALGAVNMARKDRLQEAAEAKRVYRVVVRDLALAIHRHRDVTTRVAGIEPSSADLELWQVLEEIRVPMGPDDRQFTLTEMVQVWLQPAASTKTSQ